MFLPIAEPPASVPTPRGNAQWDVTDDPASIYRWLTAGGDADAGDAFDLHVTACILALAIAETIAEHRPLSGTTGLDQADLASVIGQYFPHTAPLLHSLPGGALIRDADEECLLDLLRHCATDGSAFQIRLAAMIARRAQSPNHLWQDLGLRDRGELGRLMARHFRPLSARNNSDMKWKKFLYRMICRDAGYSLCTAPSCSECCDFEQCFGDESGESRLARVRRNDDLTDA